MHPHPTTTSWIPTSYDRVCDFWEHAYYLDYRQDRAGWLAAWWDKLANWQFAERQYDAALGSGEPWQYPPRGDRTSNQQDAVLITVYHGETREAAEEQGCLRFEAVPVHGCRVEVSGAFYVFRQSWHVPSDALPAPKAAILISERLESIFRYNAPATRKPTIRERFSFIGSRR